MKKTATISHNASNQGLTLVEILVGMGILVFLTAGVIAIQALVARSEEFSVKTIFTTENANTAVQSMIAELRTAQQSEHGAHPIQLALDQEIEFYSNADADPEIEKIRYFLEGTELKKTTTDPEGFPVTYPADNEVTKTVAEFITNDMQPIFTYYNQDWPTDTTSNPLPTPANLSEISLIRVLVRANADPSQPQGELVLESSAQVRSLKTNL